MFERAVTRALHLVRERIDVVTAAVYLPPLDATPDEAFRYYLTEEGMIKSYKLQRTLTRAADDLKTQMLLQTSTTAARARYFACTSTYASSWLSDPFLAQPMSPEAHGAACKLRLNQPLNALTHCHCGASLEGDPWHVLSHKGGPEAMRRHDEIVNRLAEAIQRAGGQAWIEPRQNVLGDRRRTDIFAVMGARSFHLDVCVTHPTARTYVATASQGHLRSTLIAAQRKRHRFATLAAAEGAVFVPFILETFGGFGAEACDFLKDLARFARLNSSAFSVSETRLIVRSEIHKALFEGNLRIAHAEFQQSNPIRYASGRHGAIPPRPMLQAPDYDSDEEGADPSPTPTTQANAPPPISSEAPLPRAPAHATMPHSPPPSPRPPHATTPPPVTPPLQNAPPRTPPDPPPPPPQSARGECATTTSTTSTSFSTNTASTSTNARDGTFPYAASRTERQSQAPHSPHSNTTPTTDPAGNLNPQARRNGHNTDDTRWHEEALNFLEQLRPRAPPQTPTPHNRTLPPTWTQARVKPTTTHTER